MLILKSKHLIDSAVLSLQNKVDLFKNTAARAPKLVVVLVGEDPASVIYTSKKGASAEKIGIEHSTIKLPGDSSPAKVKTVIDSLNSDPNVDGILIQRPLPKSFDEKEVVYWIDPSKDVDAFHPSNVGSLSLGLPCFAPCTPAGVMDLLDYYKIQLSGKIACVLGRSSIVGKPMAQLLLSRDATVLHCHSKTSDLQKFTSQADILVVAIGKPKFIVSDHIKPSAVVIDVGIHRLEDGTICGDVDFDSVSQKASAITPVPGGVGPLTIHTLLKNTLRSAEIRKKI